MQHSGRCLDAVCILVHAAHTEEREEMLYRQCDGTLVNCMQVKPGEEQTW